MSPGSGRSSISQTSDLETPMHSDEIPLTAELSPAGVGGRRVERELAILVLLAFVLNLCGITWGLPSTDDWAIDSVAPLGPLSYVHRMIESGHWWSKYPPLHFALLALVYAPYLGLLRLTGAFESGMVHYPYGFAHPETALAALVLIARLVSAAMGVGVAIAAYLIARELAGRRAGFFAGLLFAGSPLALYYANSGNLDMPYMFWSSLALVCAVRVGRGAPLGTYVWLGVLTAAAIATKDQAYGLFLLMPLPLLALHLRRGGCGARDPRVLAGLGAAVVTYLLTANVLIDFAGWRAHLRYVTHEGSTRYQMYPATVAGYLALAGQTLRLTIQALPSPAAALAVGGLVWALARRCAGAGLLAFAACSYAVAFLGPILYVLPRFVLPIVFVLTIFAGLAAARLWDSRRAWARSGVAAAIAYTLAYGASMDLGLVLDSRYAAEKWLAAHLAPETVVGTDGALSYLPRLPPGVRVVPVTMTPDGPVAAHPPEYLVLSDAHYRRYLRREQLRAAVEQLLAGDLGYEPVAIFHQPGLPATDLIPSVNPRIVVLRRRSEAAPRAEGVA